MLDALADADEAVLICHGSDSCPSIGRGLCVASKGLLPPSVLPPDDLPGLSELVLSWRDLAELPGRSRLLVTNACSAGQSRIGGGGVRLGFEQLLGLEKPTTVISPLWDIEQEPSLTWFTSFYAARLKNRRWPIERAVRQAATETEKIFPHPYRWAAFTISGPLETN